MIIKAKTLISRAAFALAMPCGLLLASIDATAQQDPAAQTSPVLPSVDVTPQSTVTGPDLFLYLTLDYRADDIAAALGMTIRLSGRPCERVTDYQIYRRDEGLRVLKVKCVGVDVYGLTVEREGSTTVYGGDGMLRSLDIDDGEIVTLYGSPVIGLGSSTDRRAREGTPVTPRVQERVGMPVWLIVVISVNVALLAVIGSIALIFWKAEGAKARDIAKQLGPMTSEAKNAMLDQAQEVLPRIFRHPNGLLIVRGRHGKRRVFRNMAFAIAYRDWGLKFREIR